MQTIYKKINIEQIKNRFGSPKNEEIWGSINNDFLISKDGEYNIFFASDEYGNIIPWNQLITEINGYRLRYGTMLNIYRFLNAFLSESICYKICIKNENFYFAKASIEDIKYEDIVYFCKNLPISYSEYVIKIEKEGKFYYSNINESGDTVDEDDEDAILLNVIDIEGNKRYLSIEQVENAVYAGDYLWVNLEYEKFLNIFKILNSENNITAILRSIKFLEFFNIAKRGEYPSTIIGYFNVPIYIEEEYEDMGIFTPLISNFIPNKEYYKNNMVEYEDEIYKLKEEYIKEPTFIKEQWEKCNEITEENREAIVESKLMTLKRKKIDLDDNGNKLPFNLVYNTGQTTEIELLSIIYLGKTYYVGGLQYLIGVPMNIIKTNDGYYFDCLSLINGLDEITGVTPNNGIAKFTYYIGNRINNIDDFKPETFNYNGIEYYEEYPWSLEIKDFNVSIKENDENPKQFIYYNIQYENYVKEFVDGKLYSTIKYPISISNIKTNIQYVKDEALMGLQDFKIDAEDLIIERGKSSAFEQHNILGEISTFDDLEKFKNGYFTLKDDENN